MTTATLDRQSASQAAWTWHPRTSPGSDARANGLLAALPEAQWRGWRPLLEPVELPLGKVLYEPGRPQEHVYFPTTAIVSLVYVMEDGACAEFAMVGKEGVVGVPLFMGWQSTTSRAMVQSAGLGFRLKAQAVSAEFSRAGPVMNIMLSYTLALLTQTAQTAICNRHHTLEKQLCRWLLHTTDRLQSSVLVTTQEWIANMLGVRRESVTEAALKLQAAEIIFYTRGRITVLDRPALMQRSCECYSVVKKEYERLLPQSFD